MFGALWVTQAALPYLRAQRSGHIIQVSSIGGITAFQNVGIYHASKWALEGFSQSLAQEVAPFGIHVTLDRAGRILHGLGRSVGQARRPRCRTTTRCTRRPIGCARSGSPSPAIPKASAAAILKIVDAEQPPLRVFFGEVPLQLAKADYENRLKTWEEWQPVAVLAQG